MYLDVLICWPRIVIVEVNVVALACCRSIGSFVGCDLFRCTVYPAQCLKDRAAIGQTKYDIENFILDRENLSPSSCRNIICLTYRKSYKYAVLTTLVKKQADFSCLSDCHASG